MDLSIRQFVEAWRVLCSASTDSTAHTDEGVEYAFSGTPLPFFNAAILTGANLSAAELKFAAQKASAWSAQRGVPWILITTQADDDSARVLDECGFAPLMPLTGMLAKDVAPVENVPDGLELRCASTDEDCVAIFDVNSAAYGMPFDAANPVWGRASFWNDHAAVLGLLDGKPVSTTTVFLADGHRYVALVATLPGMQRRGYADAAMRLALEISKEKVGNLPTFLHASEAGRPVYERMGYDSVARHMIYIEKHFLGGH